MRYFIVFDGVFLDHIHNKRSDGKKILFCSFGGLNIKFLTMPKKMKIFYKTFLCHSGTICAKGSENA